MAHRLNVLESHRGWALWAVLAAVLALAVAQGSERFAGLVPCALCLVERWPYRVVVLLGILSGVAPRSTGSPLLWLVVLAGVIAAGLGFLHVGVEQHWWPSPLPECAAPHLATRGSLRERLASMPAHPSKPCDEPVYLVSMIPLSMAMMNMLYALAVSGALIVVLVRSTVFRRPPGRPAPTPHRQDP